MASAMHQTMQSCQNLCAMTQTQMMDEDKVDPFKARTTPELEEMLEACFITKEVLARENLIYSSDADFSKFSDTELNAMTAFVRENSRMLSVILAGGAQHFWNGQGLSTVQQLKNMYHYIDDKVKTFFMLDKIISTLDIKTKYGRTPATSKSASATDHSELCAFTVIDANRGRTSEESLQRLATVCEEFAKQCRNIATMRAGKQEDRSRKIEVKERLLVEVDSVLPMLRQHVLKIGLGRTNFQDSTNGGALNNSHKLTSLFTHAAVQDAHRAVEDCRERLMQESLFRRAKVERRLKREEEIEQIQASKEQSRGGGAQSHFGGLNGIQAYQGVIKGAASPRSERDTDKIEEPLKGSRRSLTLSPQGTTFSPDNSENAKGQEKPVSSPTNRKKSVIQPTKGGSKAKATDKNSRVTSPDSPKKRNQSKRV